MGKLTLSAFTKPVRMLRFQCRVCSEEIQPMKAGYKEIRIAPQLGGPLTSAQAKYNSPYGEITSAWKMEDGVFELTVIIPPNTKAKVVIPANTAENLILDGKPFSENAHVKLLNQNSGAFELEVLPGSYHFESF